MVEIARALSRETRVLIMDEPTAVLTRCRDADPGGSGPRAQGGVDGGSLHPHKLMRKEIADDLTIMRDGAVVWTGPASAMDEHGMAEAMVGREMLWRLPAKDGTPGGGVEVSGLTASINTLDVATAESKPDTLYRPMPR